MEHTNETEKPICPRCGNSEYDIENGVCPDCGFRADEEVVFVEGSGQELYWDRCICPVCGKTELLMEGDVCKVCGWFHDLVQKNYPDEDYCQNKMSLNQAREAYSKGLPIE